MLQICTREEIDIFQISKLLVKYDINTHISKQAIVLDGNISDQLLIMLQNNLKIVSVRNYTDDSDNSDVIEMSDNVPIVKNNNKKDKKIHHQKQILAPQIIQKYDLKFPFVKQGEIYWCDFGVPYEHEIGYMRPAIILKNLDDLGWPLALAIPVTSTEIDSEFTIKLNSFNEIIYNSDNHMLSEGYGFIVLEQIRAIDKSRLREFIGTISHQVNESIKESLISFLDLYNNDHIVSRAQKLNQQYLNLNIKQIKLLSMVSLPEMIEIIKSNYTNKVKTEKFLKLFGFDTNAFEVQYLYQAIIIASKKQDYTFNSLCELIANDSKYSKTEIERFINSGFKKQFDLKSSFAFDFIRLINNLLA